MFGKAKIGLSILIVGVAVAHPVMGDDFKLLDFDAKNGLFQFVDATETVSKTYGPSKAWLLLVYTKGHNIFKNTAYSYEQLDIDCSNEMTKMALVDNYAEDGHLASAIPLNGTWETAPPESVGRGLIKIVCDNAADKYPTVDEKSAPAIYQHIQSLK